MSKSDNARWPADFPPEEPLTKRFRLAQIDDCEVGGWYYGEPPTPEEIAAAEKRWAMRSYRDDVKNADGCIENQCGGCHYFAATGMDYGICWNEQSPLDGCITFEHGGCLQHSEITKSS